MRQLMKLRLGLLFLAFGVLGCTSTKSSNTARTGMEQMLISNAVDQALDKTDYRVFSGQNVFIDDKYLECVDKPYVLGSIRHRSLVAGANLVAKAEDADIIIEPRSGSVGTDNKDSFIGMPQMSLPGPLPISIPEVRLMSRTSQTATAKLGVVAYDAKTKHVLGQGGMAMAKADDNNWTFLGIGPYQNGSVRTELNRGTNAQPATPRPPLPYTVAFQRPQHTDEPGRLKLTAGNGEKPVEEKPKSE